MKIFTAIFRFLTIFMMSLPMACSAMPTVDVSQMQEGPTMPMAAPAMPEGFAMQGMPEMPTQASMPQTGIPTVTPEGKVVQPTGKTGKEKKGEPSIGQKDPSILQMEELKFVDKGLKGVGKVIDVFVGPFEDFGEAIPPTVSSLFGPFAHIHWSLIIRSLQKRIKKAREEYERITGIAAPKPKLKEPKKPEQPVDFMAAMQQEIQKKEPEQKKKFSITKLMPKQLIKKIYDELLVFVKKATKPIEKKSLAVAELFEPLPPIPFLVTVSDVQLALHILGLQQRFAIIEKSLKNNLESLEEIKKREMKNAIKVKDLDPMLAMAQAEEKTPQQKKAEEKKKKEEEKKMKEKNEIKLTQTKQVKSVYAAFNKLGSIASPFVKPIAQLTKDLPAMPIPLVSFLATFIALSGASMVFTGMLAGPGLAVLAQANFLYGISQSQFAIYVRNLQQLLGKLESDIKHYQDGKKQSKQGVYDPSKTLGDAQTQMTQLPIQAGAPLPGVAGSIEQAMVPEVMPQAPGMPETSAMPGVDGTEVSSFGIPAE